jgi:hypothetical protein
MGYLMRALAVQQESAVDSDGPVYRRSDRLPDMAAAGPARCLFIEQGYICRFIDLRGLSRAGSSGSAAWSRRSNDTVTADNQTGEMGVAPHETLVIRAWLEPGAKPRLRVRLVRVIPGQAERQVLSTTSAEDACEAVRNWLASLERENGSSAS